jgi:uncharacterized protein (DUF1330 family)
MAAYVVADVEITDPQIFSKYREQLPATVERYGGRFAVRGGRQEVLEGDWHPHRLIVVEFPDLSRAQAWYHSAEYAPLIALRQKSARTNLVIVEGV